ncbi:hypothetical protein BB561_000121 [Smittium simulii]|uniref:Uncharacterized protein n=1 Tax=Smittium simulii TaxID=133385 RepID=A0A2T9Z0N9_9FUNG|nr:hypothetical protein BB561_000121 [Smittium simulii]
MQKYTKTCTFFPLIAKIKFNKLQTDFTRANLLILSSQFSTKAKRYLGGNLSFETWVLQTGNYETDQQAMSVAQELGVPIVVKMIKPTLINTTFQGSMGNLYAKYFGMSGLSTSDKMPKYVIAASNMAIPACLEIKQKSNKKSYVAFLGKPNCFLGKMDLIMMSLADKMLIRRLGPAIAARGNIFFSKLPIAVSKIHNQSAENQDSKAVNNNTIANFENEMPYSKLAKTNPDLINIYDATQENIDATNTKIQRKDKQIYLKFMNKADKILVTPESLITISSAISLKKPVYVINQEGTSKILRQYHHYLSSHGLVKRLYLGSNSLYSYMLDNPTQEADKFSITSVARPKSEAKFIDLKLEAQSIKRFAELILRNSGEKK